MPRTEEDFAKALLDAKIPILTLDYRWHQLFGHSRITPELKELEDTVNDLLKKQGKLNTETKQVKSLKKKLMDEIVSMTDQIQENTNAEMDAEIDEHKKLLDECNDKLSEIHDQGLDLPRELNQANLRLMLASMKICHERFQNNTLELNETDAWLKNIREELKKNIMKKQEMEVDNYGLFTYMHDFFGEETLQLFEMTYNPGLHPPKKKNENNTEQK